MTKHQEKQLLNLDGAAVEGRNIKVMEAKPKEDKPRGGGGFRSNGGNFNNNNSYNKNRY